MLFHSAEPYFFCARFSGSKSCHSDMIYAINREAWLSIHGVQQLPHVRMYIHGHHVKRAVHTGCTTATTCIVHGQTAQ
jgi:hypothetical protein